jgi:hypothetical protein
MGFEMAMIPPGGCLLMREGNEATARRPSAGVQRGRAMALTGCREKAVSGAAPPCQSSHDASRRPETVSNASLRVGGPEAEDAVR